MSRDPARSRSGRLAALFAAPFGAVRRHCARHPSAGAWIAISIGVTIASTSGRSHAADTAPVAASSAATVAATAPAPLQPNWRDLRVEVVGTGRPVLMIPGLNSGADTWTETCRALQPGVQCHLVQLPGFAGLPAAATGSEPWLEAMRDRLLAYADERHLEQPVVMGHSLGGVLALMMGVKAPARFERLVIVDSLPFFPAIRNPAATEADGRAAAKAMADNSASMTPEQRAAMTASMARGMTRSEAGVQRLVQWGATSDPATTTAAMTGMMTTDLRPQLAGIKRPVLVLGSWAAYAPMGATMAGTRAIFEAQYASLPGATLRMSEQGYHFLMWDDADWLVSQVRDFAALH